MAKSNKKKPAFKVGDLVTIRPAARKEHKEYIKDGDTPVSGVFRVRVVFPSMKLFGGKTVTETGYGLELPDKYGPSIIMDEPEIRAYKEKRKT